MNVTKDRHSSASSRSARETIDIIRGFNRFYTRQLGLLDHGLLGSEFTLTEARVLYELAHRDESTATQIADELGLDLGYLSRLLTKFERRRYLRRTRSPLDGRQSRLQLTAKGRDVFSPLDQAAREQIRMMTGHLTPPQHGELLAAMQSVRRLLDSASGAPGGQAAHAAYLIRPLQIGDIGWVTHRQGLLYAQEYGWDRTYESLVAEILANFVKNFDARFENAWVAERDHVTVGSVFLVRASDRLAKLRLLYVEPSVRGLGIGRRLVHQCIDCAREKGYKSLTLWTNDVLVSARRIYEAAGFRLTKEEPHHSFGKDLLGQTWELVL
jgi:DNA-binding MarR family transcriptional regulator/GNAT superfamily N-acetyltransferase